MIVSPAGAGRTAGSLSDLTKPASVAGAVGGSEPTAAAVSTADSAARAVGAFAIIEGFALAREPRNCALNHSRKASSEILMPSPLNPALIAASDSPARRSLSSSLRWGSSWSVLGFLGQRAWATNSVRVGFLGGTIPEWFGGVVGVMWERYSEPCGGAIGATWFASRPAGLDVGVLPYFFLLFWFNRLRSPFDFLVSWFTGLIDLLVFSFGSLAELDYLSAWILGFVKFQSKFVLGVIGLGLVAGGGGC